MEIPHFMSSFSYFDGEIYKEYWSLHCTECDGLVFCFRKIWNNFKKKTVFSQISPIFDLKKRDKFKCSWLVLLFKHFLKIEIMNSLE